MKSGQMSFYIPFVGKKEKHRSHDIYHSHQLDTLKNVPGTDDASTSVTTSPRGIRSFRPVYVHRKRIATNQ
ncbi:hypothetical protein E2986_14065 [Frieseomelitta varia]|uniref:Uncharacterized protein n=1 Tax=Frieseomelitta varia TaxID=561572 RepID=A0A833RV55_9HYME|nr:hypothetical protein E2986_14065 [Frieseomelitta varia]